MARPAERKFLGFSFTSEGAEAAHRAQGPAALQAEDTGADATDTGNQSGADDERTRQLLAWLEELLRLLRDTLGAEEAGSMDTAQAAIHDLDALEAQPLRFRQLHQRGVGKALAAQTVGSSHSSGGWRIVPH